MFQLNVPRKKLRAEIQRQWPLITADLLLDLVPTRSEMLIVKAAVNSQEFVNIYFQQSQPVIFEFDDVLYPTGEQMLSSIYD